MVEYAYKPSFDAPITYQYSKYEGKDFLNSYKDYRGSKISKEMPSMSWESNLSAEELINKIKSEQNMKKKLKHLLSLQEKNAEKEFVYSILSIFTKKYEVFKRLYDHYNEQHKKIGNISDDIQVYMLFSANLILYLKKELNYKFLNVLLKVNDLICNKEKEQSDLFNFIIHSEIEVIEQCMKEKGVAYG